MTTAVSRLIRLLSDYLIKSGDKGTLYCSSRRNYEGTQ